MKRRMGRLLATHAAAMLCLGVGLAADVAAQSPGGGAQGYLKARVNPGRAGVFVDGKYLGPAANFKIARKYAVPAGEHEVELAEPRYEEVMKKVTIRAGETLVLTEQLKPVQLAQPPFGVLRIVGFSKFDAVYVNGKFYGHADEFSNFAQGLQLNPGEYAVRIDNAGGTPAHEEKVRVEADKVAMVKAK